MASQKKEFFTALNTLDKLNETTDSEEDGSFAPLKGSNTPPSSAAVSKPLKKRKATTHTAKPPSILPSSSDPTQSISSSDRSAKKSKRYNPPPSLKRAQSAPAGKAQAKPSKSEKQEVVPESEQIFQGLTFFYIPNSDIKSARKIRISKAVTRGAHWVRSCEPGVTHIIVDADLDITEALKELPGRAIPPRIPVVRCTWQEDCINEKNIMDVDRSRFRVQGMSSPFDVIREPATFESEPRPQSTGAEEIEKVLESPQSSSPHEVITVDELDQTIALVQKLNIPDVDQFIESDPTTRSQASSWASESLASGDPPENIGFLCMEKNDGSSLSPNLRTILIFLEMADRCEQAAEPWRPGAYRRGANALRKEPELIKTYSEAMAIKGIEHSLANKIVEITSTDRLRKLDFANADPDEKTRRLFRGVYGCGPQQAQQWISQGYRTLDDLRQYAHLTPNQRVGIAHYDDFQTRIPRTEVEAHAAIVEKALRLVDADLQMIVGGSFRRGNSDSGDIDILITKPDASLEVVRSLMTGIVVPELTENGFLTAVLATSHARDDGSKWHGASALPGSPVWRRLDLLFVPWNELGAALIYFTGNDIFNCSIRFLAGKKGMRLNQRGLYQDVMRGKRRRKLTEGNMLEGRSEERIFELLGVPFRPPHHRKP